MNERELKPCPFCGSTPMLRRGKTDEWYHVECGNRECPIYVETRRFYTQEEAIEVWNRRASNE